MIVADKNNCEAKKVSAPGFEGAAMQALVGPEQGWKGHVMRLVSLEKGGHTSRHSHPWPHINYFAKGEGTLFLDGKEYPVQAGSYAYIPANKEHQFLNSDKEQLEFICIVPEEGHK
jgi:quercetin dioxygenase-like cupin family protein